MVVSNFEVSRSTSGNSFPETYYQLQVTNMAGIEIEFLVEIHIGADPSINYLLPKVFVQVQNHTGYLDDFAFKKRGQEYVKEAYFTIAPKASAVFEIRQLTEVGQLLGCIVLRVPPVRKRNHLIITTQQDEAVKVLLSASRLDYRGFAKTGIRDMDGLVKYQIAYTDRFSSQAIAISTGKAENEITPEGFGLRTSVTGFAEHMLQESSGDLISQGALRLGEEDKIPALIDLLTILEGDEKELKALNKLLTECGARVRVSHSPLAGFQ